MLELNIFKRLDSEHIEDNLNETTYRNGNERLFPLNLHFIKNDSLSYLRFYNRLDACFEIVYSFLLKIVLKIHMNPIQSNFYVRMQITAHFDMMHIINYLSYLFMTIMIVTRTSTDSPTKISFVDSSRSEIELKCHTKIETKLIVVKIVTWLKIWSSDQTNLMQNLMSILNIIIQHECNQHFLFDIDTITISIY